MRRTNAGTPGYVPHTPHTARSGVGDGAGALQRTGIHDGGRQGNKHGNPIASSVARNRAMQRSKYHAPLYRLARSLPFAEVPTSVLRCSFSKKLMDEEDAPCSLPNGRAVCKSLISRLALDLYAQDLPLSAWLQLGLSTHPCPLVLSLSAPLELLGARRQGAEVAVRQSRSIYLRWKMREFDEGSLSGGSLFTKLSTTFS